MRTLAILAVAIAAIAMALSLGAVTSDAAISDVPASEETVITEDTVIATGETVTVDGSLVVAEGATLTVEDGGKLRITETGSMTVDGTLICGEGVRDDETLYFGGVSMVINGMGLFEGDDSVTTADGKPITINGYVSIPGEIRNTYELEVSETGTAEVGESRFYAVCHGTIVLDSHDISGLTEIDLGLGGKVVVESLGRTLMLLLVDEQAMGEVGDAARESCLSAMSVGGFTVESFEEDGSNSFRLYGECNPNGTSGGMFVTEETHLHIGDFAMAEGTYIGPTGSAHAIIDGDMTAPADAFSDIEAEVESAITVLGSLTVISGEFDDSVVKLNAAGYTDADGNSVYVPLEDAVRSGADAITLHGENSIDDPSMLAGIAVTTAEGATLSIGEAPRTASENGYLVAIAILAVAVIALACVAARRRAA